MVRMCTRGRARQGDVLEATGLSDDKNWIRLADGTWVMIHHPSLGQLLELLEPDDDEGDLPFGAPM